MMAQFEKLVSQRGQTLSIKVDTETTHAFYNEQFRNRGEGEGEIESMGDDDKRADLSASSEITMPYHPYKNDEIV